MKVLLFVFFTCFTTSLMACRCAPPKPIAENIFINYDLVVKGLVVKVAGDASDFRIYILVHQQYRGEQADTVVIHTSLQSAGCGLFAEVGNQFLMYANLSNGRYHTNSCTRTALLNSPSGCRAEHVEGDLRFLENHINTKE